MSATGKDFLTGCCAIQIECDRAKFSRGFESENFQVNCGPRYEGIVLSIRLKNKFELWNACRRLLILTANDRVEHSQRLFVLVSTATESID